MANSSPLRVNVCDHHGSCVAVQTGFQINLHGTVAEVPLHRVSDVIEALNDAADEFADDYPGDREPFATVARFCEALT